jgi:hypothetical protein
VQRATTMAVAMALLTRNDLRGQRIDALLDARSLGCMDGLVKHAETGAMP